jgi:hypothetical protein
MFDMIWQTFAQKILVKIPNRGQNPRSQKGWFSFLARSPNFTIEVQNRPIRKLFLISGNTFFVIGEHSNFECKLAKNRVDCAVNSNPSRGKSATSSDVPRQTVDQNIRRLWESCRSIAPLQLLFLEIFKFVDNFWSFVISKAGPRNKNERWRRAAEPARACARPRHRVHVATKPWSGVRMS